jgi:hypothetical protein
MERSPCRAPSCALAFQPHETVCVESLTCALVRPSQQWHQLKTCFIATASGKACICCQWRLLVMITCVFEE